jgi:transcriptional regulator with XRE-family HTH domain
VGIAELISSRRIELGLTQAELADALNTASGRTTLTRHDVSRWERGVVTPRSWLAALGVVLHIPVADLRLATRSEESSSPVNVAALALDWLGRELPQAQARRAGRRVGRDLVIQLHDRVGELRRLDDHLAGGDTHRLVSRELAATVRLADEASYTERTGRGLFAAIGELAQLAGWVSSDAGLEHQASDYYLLGRRAAEQGGDRSGAANNLSSLAYQFANSGDPVEAVVLARAAASGATEAPPRVRALLMERVAWAHARAGEHEPVERALGAVDDLLEVSSADGAHEPPWVYWLDRREADIMAGRCYTELRRPLRAVPLLEAAIAGYDEVASRELGLYLSWLAIAYADAREVDAACRTAGRMVVLGDRVSSMRIRVRVEHVVARLREFGDRAQVRELL